MPLLPGQPYTVSFSNPNHSRASAIEVTIAGQTYEFSITSTTSNPSTHQLTFTPGQWQEIYSNTKTNTSCPVFFILRAAGIPGRPGMLIATKEESLWYGIETKPTLNMIVAVETNTAVSSVLSGVFLKNLSAINLLMTQYSGKYKATIDGFRFTIDGTVYPGSPSKLIHPKSTTSIVVKAQVQDSRGYWSNEASLTVPITDYTGPTIKDYKVTRALATGVENQLGTYAKHTGSLTVKSVKKGTTEYNKINYKIEKNVNGQMTTVLSPQVKNLRSHVLLHTLGTYDIKISTNFRLTLTDAFGQVAVENITLPSAQVPVCFSKRGVSVGGIFDESDPSNLQVYGSVNIKGGGSYLINGQPLSVSGGGQLFASSDGGQPLAASFGGGGEPINGDHLNGWQDLPNGLRKVWFTITQAIIPDNWTNTNTLFYYPLTVNKTWTPAFTARPSVNLTVTCNQYPFVMGSAMDVSDLKLGTVALFSIEPSPNNVTIYIEGIGPR